MSIPLEKILEPVFAGTVFLTLLGAIVWVVTGGKSPELARPVIHLLFQIGEEPRVAGKRSIHSPGQSNQSKTTHNLLKEFFIVVLLVSVIYSLGIAIERTADELKDGLTRHHLLPGKTDAEIRVETFRKRFEHEWPESKECLPYSDEEIIQIYYTANNFLKRSDPRAQELMTLLRRTHFSESMAALFWIFGFYPWLAITIMVFVGAAYRRIKGRVQPRLDLSSFKQSVSERWGAIRWTRTAAVTLAFLVFFGVANYAWILDEKRYDQRVFGYYLVELQLSGRSGEKLPRTPAGEQSSCAPPDQRLQGLRDTTRFDASGVAWLDRTRDAWWWWLLHGTPVPRFVVVNDKDPRLTIHAPDGSLKGVLDLPEEFRELRDLEEITRAPDGTFYLLASHSTYRQHQDPQRQHLYRFSISHAHDPENSKEIYSIVGLEKIGLVEHLENTCFDKERTKCLRGGWQEPNRDCCDINIEGMALSPDSRYLFLGFREPLICQNGKPSSPIFRLDLQEHQRNPAAPLTLAGLVPALQSDTAFRGPHRISGMTYDPKRKSYWILTSYERKDEEQKNRVPPPCNASGVASATTSPSVAGGLWKWDGMLQQEPKLYCKTESHKPEGIAVNESGDLIIVFDDDNQSLTDLHVPYAYFSRGAPPSVRPHCTPLLPR